METDRRVIRERIKKTRERVDEVRRRRETAARARERRLLPTMAIVGYTNAGKSTLLNALVGEEAAVVEDMLFATLDPTTRRVRLHEGQTVIVSDTVGFIHKLPHQLVEAFQATLEEVIRADVLLEVVDLADRHAAEHRRTVQTVLDELGAGHKPRVVVLNKVDCSDPWVSGPPAGLLSRDDQHVVRVSALTGRGHRGAAEQAGDRAGRPVAGGRSERPLLRRGAAGAGAGARHGELRVPRRGRARPGRVPPSMAGELRRKAAAWERARRATMEPTGGLKTAAARDRRSRSTRAPTGWRPR